MPSPRFATLAEWLAWQERLHPRAIDLGLDRIRAVAARLGLEHPPYPVITIGGTNGKGSCVAFLEAMLRAQGYRTGAYTSPHLLRYNERIRVSGDAVGDAALCRAFARIDAARGDISLTYFEFGALAALEIFRIAEIQVALLEVGLGGRLDAVNIIDGDAAVVTSIGIDHEEWLGADRDGIGWEKAGIFRRGRPAICGDPSPPPRLLAHAHTIDALLYRFIKDYNFHYETKGWSWRHGERHVQSLPLPALAGEHQLSNAAAALMALTALADELPVSEEAMRRGLATASLPGRFQVFPGPVTWILDVAHNAHAAIALARCLKRPPWRGRTHLVWGMLEGKKAVDMARALDEAVDCWYVSPLGNPQGQAGETLAAALGEAYVSGSVTVCTGVQEACHNAIREAKTGDRIVVTGSFHTVAQIFALNPTPPPQGEEFSG